VALTFDGTDKLLVSYEHATLQTWQYATDKEPGKNLDKVGDLGSYGEGFGGRVLVSPQSSKVLHAGSTGVRIWDLANPEQPGALVSAQSEVGLSGAQLATNVAGRPLLADTAYQPFIRLWDLSIPTEPTNLAVYRSLNPEGTGLDILAKSGAVAMSPDGAILAGSEIADGRPLVTLRRTTAPTDPPVARITDLDNGAIALSLTGHVLAVVDNVNFEPERQEAPSLKLYDVGDPAHPRRVATLPTPEIYWVSNSPDGRLLTAFTATTMLAWDITDPENPQALPSRRLALNTLFTQGSFSSDGKLLVTSAGAAGIELWRVENDRIIDPPIVVQHTRGSAMAFSLDVRTLAIASNTGPTVTIALWDVSDPTTPVSRGTWSTTRNTLTTSLIFGGDGNILVIATDGGVDLWDVDPIRVSRKVCDTIGDVITEAQWARYVPNLPYKPPCPAG
jgi:WD40 repeat protein